LVITKEDKCHWGTSINTFSKPIHTKRIINK
jgi:hypothetical protein